MKDLANFYKRYEGAPAVEILHNLYGEAGIIIMTAAYNDFTAYQKVFDQVMNDPEYFEFIKRAADVFIEGSGRATIMRVIEY